MTKSQEVTSEADLPKEVITNLIFKKMETYLIKALCIIDTVFRVKNKWSFLSLEVSP